MTTAMDWKPNMYIVGAPKCGTTSLYAYLDQHPEIFMSNPKEPRYFCKDFHQEAKINNSQRYFPTLTRKEYEDCFRGAEGHQIIGEASPIYLYSKVALKNIKDFNENAKIIIMLRDPVEQMHSWYYQSLQTGKEWATSFKKALELEKVRKNGEMLPDGRFPSSLFYTDLANYPPQIKRAQKHFPSEQIKFILLDNLKNHPGETYKSTLKFLGVENTSFAPNFEVKNLSSTPRSKWINKLKSPGENIKGLIKSTVPRKIVLKTIDILDGINLSKKERPEIPQKLRNDLMSYFKKSVEETAELTNRNLVQIWGYGKR